MGRGTAERASGRRTEGGSVGAASKRLFLARSAPATVSILSAKGAVSVMGDLIAESVFGEVALVAVFCVFIVAILDLLTPDSGDDSN
ncbi:MAG: hypothetical protein KGL35_09950 [Bradyrhizobium sp.]|nr:hypothetical protein [Bradyrhizobium sp.]